MAFSRDGKRLATNDKQIVYVWDTRTGDRLATLEGHSAGVMSVAFHPDGSRLVTSSPDGTIRLWDVETGKEMLSLKEGTDTLHDAAFSPDGKWLASVSERGGIKLWVAEDDPWQRRPETEAELTMEVQQRPNDPLAVLRRGRHYAVLGRWAEADRDFESVVRLASGYRESVVAEYRSRGRDENIPGGAGGRGHLDASGTALGPPCAVGRKPPPFTTGRPKRENRPTRISGSSAPAFSCSATTPMDIADP